MESWLCNPSWGIIALGSWLWKLRFGVLALGSWWWSHNSDILIVESWLGELGFGIFVFGIDLAARKLGTDLELCILEGIWDASWKQLGGI